MTKRINTFIYSVVVMAAVLLLCVFGFTMNALAAEGTDDDNVEIYCTYTDEDGNEVCGDTLEAGTYNMGFYTKNVDRISVIEITATYDTDVVTIEGITDSISTMASMGTVNNNGDFVIGYVSDGNYVNTDINGQYIATAKITVNIECDAEKYITVSENPNLTFIVTDSSNNNYGDEYALVSSFEGYTQGKLALMSCDVSPAISGEGYDVTGCITIASDTEGSASDFGIVGITVDVLDANGNIVQSSVTDDNGNYILTSVPAGEYKLSVYGPTTIDREVTLKVDSNKIVQDLGIVICDYNKDSKVNSLDFGQFMNCFNDEYSVYADFNNDNKVNTLDFGSFMIFYGKTINYPNVTL